MKKTFPYIFGLIVLILAPILFWHTHKKNMQDYASTMRRFSDVYFQGQVISANTIRGVGVLCVSIDSASVDSLHFFSRGEAALTIESGIATFPLGLIDKNNSEDLFRYNSHYVIVNKDKSGQMLFIKDNDTLSVPLTFFPAKMYYKTDMPNCANH